MGPNGSLSKYFAIIAATVFLLGVRVVAAPEYKSGVEGVVQDEAGKAVTGAFVKLKNSERHLEFMVISQAQGRYTVKNLPAGQYVVQGVGGGYQSNVSAPLTVAAGKTAKLNLALTVKQGPALSHAWPMKTPEAEEATLSENLPDGDGKKLVSARCTTCHSAARFMSFHMSQERWETQIREMRVNMRAARLRDLTDAEARLAVEYLASNFPPNRPADPNDRLPRTLLQGKALHYRVVQYDISDSNQNAEPHDVAVDSHGNAWVGERIGKLGRLDAKTLEFTEIPIPEGSAKPDEQRLGNPIIEPNGQMWVTDGPNARWMNYDINTGKFTIYDWPKSTHGTAGGNTILVHPNGTIWATGANQARMLDPATREFKFFETPSYLATKEAGGAYGMSLAGDGSVWWAEDKSDRMARVEPATGKVEEFKIPFDGYAYPRRLTHDVRGDLWVSLWNGGRLMKIDYETKQMTLFAPPTETPGTYSVSVDRKNNLIWVSEQMADKIARFNPKTGEWVEFPLPDSESDPRTIEVDPTNPNRVWWSGNLAARVGFIEVLNDN
jgi:streptogramin lyase/mono/diheme cytochrome c family protein